MPLNAVKKFEPNNNNYKETEQFSNYYR